MSTDTQTSDLGSVLKSIVEGVPVDASLQKKAIETADRIRGETARNFGVLNVAVDLIREVREG